MSQLMVLTMLLFFGLTVPVAVAIGLASMLGVGLEGRMPWLVIAQQLYAALDKYPLMAVPFFILAGNLMESGGIRSEERRVGKEGRGRGWWENEREKAAMAERQSAVVDR